MIIKKKILLAVFVVGLSIMACANIEYGDVISDAEATRRALPTITPESSVIEYSTYKQGDNVVIIGGKSGALVPLYGSAGARFFSSQVLHGTKVTVLGLHEIDDVIWYQVEGLIGAGWLLEEHLMLLEDYEAEKAAKE